MSEKKVYGCKNVGCRSIFDWPMQLARHTKTCLKPPPPAVIKKYFFKDNAYCCSVCNKSYTHQSNIVRHVKNCKGKKSEKTLFECNKCSKIFQYKCRLQAHLKNHTDMKVCEVCNQKFRRLDLFEAHQNVCFNVDNDKFVPSFLVPTENQLLSHLSDDQVVPLDTEALDNHTLSSDEQVDLSVFNVSTSDLLTPDSTQIRSDLNLNSSEATTPVSNEHSNTTTVPDSITTALE